MSRTQWLVPMAAGIALLGSSAGAQVCLAAARNLTASQVRANSRAQISLNGSKITYTYPRQAGAFQNDVWVMNADGSGKTRINYDVSIDPATPLTADTWSSEWSGISADGNTVVFHAWDNLIGSGQTDLVLANTLTGQARQITSNPAMDAYPALSPDGSKVVFLSKRATSAYQVFVMKAEPESDTNIPVQLTNFANTKFARFTPDGKIIFGAVTADTGGAFEVFRMDAADANSDTIGDNLVRLTNSAGVAASEPSQMTAGGRIYYVGKFSFDGKSHVLSMNADGTDIKQVTGGDYDETYAFAAGNLLIASITDPANGVGNMDVEAFPLGLSTNNGTVSGVLTGPAGAPIANATVKIYTLKTLVTTVTTDASGAYTATLPPGGYSLQFVPPAAPASATVVRGVTVTPDATAVKDLAITPNGAPRPLSLMATYTMDLATMGASADPVTYAYSGVSLAWAPGSAPAAGWTVSGYNVYTAPSETGPWTKINDTLVEPVAPLRYTAPVPANPAAAFYAITTVSANGSSTLESAFSDAAQAANNMLWNGGMDTGDSSPVGFDRVPAWWDTTDWHTQPDESDKVGDGKSVANTAGTTPTTMSFYSDYTHTTPVKPNEDYVASMYAKLTDYPGTGLVSAGLQHATSTPSSMWWGDTSYPAEYALPTLKGGGSASPNVDWTYLANTNALRTWEDVDHTRFGLTWDSTGATVGLSRVLFDDARVQVRRVGPTGTIFGRIQQSGAKSVGGILVSAAGKSTRTDGIRGQFVLYDVPTGMVELTFTLPDYDPTNTPGHQFKVTVPNYGGFAFGRSSGTNLNDTTIWESLPRTLLAIVKDEQGQPIENANVRFLNWKGENEISGTTDATGQFSVAQPAEFQYGAWWEDNSKSMAMANAPGRVGIAADPFWSMTDTSFGGWDVVEMTLPRSPIMEAVQATTAPTIDGNVTSGEWGNTQKVELLESLETGGMPVTRTWAYAKWDTSNLYLAYASEEPNPGGMVALSPGQDGEPAIWNGDDLFAAWLDPTNFGGTGVGHEYWQIMSNSRTVDPGLTDILWRQNWSNGACPFIWDRDAENISGLTFKSKVDASGHMWYTEMAIPLASLASSTIAGGLPAQTVSDGTEWAVNLQRMRSQSLAGGENGQTGTIILRFVNTLSAPMKGDMNSDRAVTVVDAAIALKVAAGLQAAGSAATAGDVVGGDGKVTTADALRILRFVHGLESSL